MVHDPARRLDRLRREPAEEVPGHLPDQLRQRPRGHPTGGAADRPLLDRRRGQDLPRRQPAHQAAAVLGVAAARDQHRVSGGRLPRRGVHPPGDAAVARRGRLPAVVHLLHLAQHENRARRVPARPERRDERLPPPQPVRQHPRHPHRVPAVRRTRRLQGPGGDRGDRRPRPGACTPATNCSRTSRGRAAKRTSTTRSTSTSRATGPRREKAGSSLAPYLTQLNRIRRRTRRFGSCATSCHWSDDDSILVYTKYLAGEFTKSGNADGIIVVANVDPHSVRETTVHLDLTRVRRRAGHSVRRARPHHRPALHLGRGQLRAARRFHRTGAHARDRLPEGPLMAKAPKSSARLPELHPGLISSLVAGYHPHPHDTLGQHALDGGCVIRAVRPLASTVTAVRADGTRVALSHVADGLWQGFAPGEGQAYTLETTYDDGPAWDDGRPVPLRAHRRRDRPLPLGRGTARAALAGARCALPPARGRRGHLLHGLGAARPGRARHRRLQRLERRLSRHASTRRQRRVGALRPRTHAGQRLQVRAAHAVRRVGDAVPTRWRGTPRSRRRPHPSSGTANYDWSDSSLDRPPRRGATRTTAR